MLRGDPLHKPPHSLRLLHTEGGGLQPRGGLRPPIWWLKWVPVLGVALMGAQALSLLVHRFKDREAAEGGER